MSRYGSIDSVVTIFKSCLFAGTNHTLSYIISNRLQSSAVYRLYVLFLRIITSKRSSGSNDIFSAHHNFIPSLKTKIRSMYPMALIKGLGNWKFKVRRYDWKKKKEHNSPYNLLNIACTRSTICGLFEGTSLFTE